MKEYGINGSLRERTDNALQKTKYYLFKQKKGKIKDKYEKI